MRGAKAGSIALAIVLVSGLAASAHAAEGAANLSARSGKAGSSLSLNGKEVHTTPGTISRHRVIPMTGSRTLVATWNETVGGVTASYFAISLDGKRFDQVQQTANMVRTDYARFDPLQGTPVIPEALRAGPDNELFFVQFVSTPLDEMRSDIMGLGGVVETFMTDNVHVVRMNASTRAQVAALPYVRWVGEYHTAYKLHPDIRQLVLAAGPDAAAERFSIECLRRGPAQQQLVSDAVNGLKGVVDVTIPDQFRLEVTLTPANLLEIARRNEVNFVCLSGFPFGHDMNIIRQISGATPLLSGLGFNGQGVRGEVFDGGCITNHVEWAGQSPIIRTTSANDSHGSACYGINFATGSSDPNARGFAWQREAGASSRYQDTNQSGLGTGVITRLSLNTGAVDPLGNVRSCYQTSSVGSPRVTTYTAVSAEVDDYLFLVDYLSLQSQSNANNTRDSRPQAWAKNIISIGAIQPFENTNRADDVHAAASIGPADDFRVKPDLSHQNANVYTTYSTSATGYGQFGGTSSATPITAGHAGLILQMWHEGVWAGHGGGSSVFASRPKSTTAKAIMINGCYRYVATAANTMYRRYVGWGMADLTIPYNDRARTFIVNETEVLTNAQTKLYEFNVAAGQPDLRATMIFSDPKGNPAAGQDRINDLSLKVTAPNGTIYWGNNGMIATTLTDNNGAIWSTPGGAANTVDTVENVFVQNPAAGVWKVEVIATQIVQDARLETPGVTDADFALVVVAGPLVVPPPVCYADCDGVGGLTANDFSCFLNAFANGQSYANCDGVGGLTANDFSCFLNAYANGCS